MIRMLLLSTAVVAFGLLASTRASAANPNLHRAVYELREAYAELEKAPYTFGGHKSKAMELVLASYTQIEKCLEAVGDGYKKSFKPANDYPNYPNHQHIRHAEVTLKDARKFLNESSSNFGGHKAKAISDIDAALAELKEAIKFAKE